MTLQITPTNPEMEPLDSLNLDIHPLLRRRASRGDFSPQALTGRQIVQLLQAARCAPSSHNSQPWQFIVVQDGPDRAEIDQDLAAWGAPWATEAPALIAVVTELESGTEHHGVNYALFDCGLAVQNILLQAASMGLAAHPVGYRDRNAVYRALNLQPQHTLLLFIAVGNPAGQAVATESSRQRKPLATITAQDRWGGAPVIEKRSSR